MISQKNANFTEINGQWQAIVYYTCMFSLVYFLQMRFEDFVLKNLLTFSFLININIIMIDIKL